MTETSSSTPESELVIAALAGIDGVRWGDGQPYVHLAQRFREQVAGGAVRAIGEWLATRAEERDGLTADEVRALCGVPTVRSLTVVVTPDELDGGFVAEVREVPGCMSQGASITEALTNVADALTEITIARAVEATAERSGT